MQSRGSMQQARPHEPHARHLEYFSLWQQPQASHPGGLAIGGFLFAICLALLQLSCIVVFATAAAFSGKIWF